MASKIQDYGLIGDTHASALVSRSGSIDWLCMPRFDSPACFASLLGKPENGYWSIGTAEEPQSVSRMYQGDTLVLQTRMKTAGGVLEVIDFMPFPSHEDEVDLVRIARCAEGTVKAHLEFVLRFDYGAVVPWVRRRPYGLSAIAGPNAVELHSPVELTNKDFKTTADFELKAGESAAFVMSWHPSHRRPPRPPHAEVALESTREWWQEWASQCESPGPWRPQILRSVITLKALTYAPTGGVVAAPTTSLPESIGGVRNWDYRYCWLRDATLTLYSLLLAGFREEAKAWIRWLLRAVAGKPDQLQIMFGISGERLLPELEVDWLSGYEGSRPVRVGNAAHRQFQLDVYGEVMDVFHVARASGIDPGPDAWLFQRELLRTLEDRWQLPDDGIWEIRGPSRQFTHSKVMAWVAFDRAIRDAQRYGLDGPVDHWRELRDTIHDQVCKEGFSQQKNAFVQFYGSEDLDASLLMMPEVGFLPATDPRVMSTIDCIREELTRDGFVIRYPTKPSVDGLPAGEGCFLPCTFWLADALILAGRGDEGREVFLRAIEACNDLGLLSEEYDPKNRQHLGNFPQAFSHVALVNTAHNLALHHGPARHRSAD